MSQQYQELLVALAKEVGLNPQSLLSTEEIAIDGLPIGLHLEGEGEQAELLLCCLLGSVPSDRWSEMSRAMLLANHLWTGTGGCTLGVMPKNNEVSLSSRRFLSELNSEKLAVMLAKMADIGLAWQDFLHSNLDSSTFLDTTAHVRA